MPAEQPKNPLHGVTLKAILEDLIARRGFEYLGARVRIRCFTDEPSLSSSLKFLRRTDWARAEVEQLYLADQREISRKKERNRQRAARRAASAAARAEAPSQAASAETGAEEVAEVPADSNAEPEPS